MHNNFYFLVVPDEPSPGTSLLKVNHYENRVTSLNVMLAHHSQPSVNDQTDISSEIILGGSSPDRTVLDESFGPGSKQLQSLADADLNGSIRDSDDDEDDDFGMDVPATDFLECNNPDDDSGNLSFSFDATETSDPPIETSQTTTSSDASEALEASSDPALDRIRSAVSKDHDYVKVDTSDSDLEPPDAKIPRLDSGSFCI